MEKEYYESTSKIWLIGDSNPSCEGDLEYPLDEIHPTRHNIWTPIYDVIQERLYHEGARLDKSKLYIRNAVENAENRCFAKKWDNSDLVKELKDMSELIGKNNPILIFTFGSFAYEFVRRAKYKDEQSPSLNLIEMKHEFDKNVDTFDSGSTNILPLLHAIVARKFKKSHDAYNGNYFEYTGCRIADILIKNMVKFEGNMIIK